MREAETRWEFADARFKSGIDETMSIDQSKHSLFGASKVAADIAVQEYGRYFDMNTCCLRGGCLTGPSHSGVESHGFLSYLVKCNLAGERYTIFGHKGKQVRDNIHSRDVARFVESFMESPSVGAVYNIGGGKPNSCSIIEAFRLTEGISGRKMKSTYSPQNRTGDHICYYTDLAKITSEYPEWDVSVSLEEIIQELVEAWRKRLAI
jgi:CDP-paratose 2-epimerase